MLSVSSSEEAGDAPWLNVGAVAVAAAGVGVLLAASCAVAVSRALRRRRRRASASPLLSDDDGYDEESRSSALPDFAACVVRPLPYSGAAVRADAVDRARQLLPALVREPLGLARALLDTAQAAEADAVAKALVLAFAGAGRAEELAAMSCAAEVDRARTCNMLLRADSAGSKVFGHFARLAALPFLWARLRPVAAAVQRQCSSGRGGGKGFDGDPFSTQELSAKVAALIVAHSQAVFDAVTARPAEFPEQLRSVLRCVSDAVAAKFPGHERLAVGGLVFLRLVSPVVTAPLAYGLFDAALPTERPLRMMVATTKLLQHLANGTRPGTHQPRLARLDAFVDRNAAALNAFYDELLRVPDRLVQQDGGSSSAAAVPVTSDDVDNALICIQQKLQRNWPLIVKNISSAEGPDSPTLRLIQGWSPQL